MFVYTDACHRDMTNIEFESSTKKITMMNVMLS
jgi:hypothetical protein